MVSSLSSPVDDVRPAVPRVVRIGAALSWRLLAMAAALYVLGTIASYLAGLVVPVAIALLLAALLAPAVDYLVKWKVPRGVAIAQVMVGALVLLGGLLTFVVVAFVNGLPGLIDQLTRSLDAISAWLTTGPLQLTERQLDEFFAQFTAMLRENQAAITTGALTTAATVGETLIQVLLVIFTLVFLLRDGSMIWRFLLGAAPGTIRPRVDVAGRRGLAALVNYVHATIVVALVDAIGIGIGLAVLGVPLVVPLAALVFLGAFIPILGAVVAGSVAVLIALAAKGPVIALLLTAIVVAVMQLESHLLQPLLLGRAVKLHPLAVILVITAGLLTAGIAGALLAVPLLAVLNASIRSLHSQAAEHANQPVDTSPPATVDKAISDEGDGSKQVPGGEPGEVTR